MLTELLDKSYVPARPPLFPPVTRRDAWEALPGAPRLIAAGEQALRDAPQPPPLPLSLWLAFHENGDRLSYEVPYFARRRALCTLAMAECAEDRGRFLPAIADYVWAVCGEAAWQVPAHNSYIRNAPQSPLPDPRPIIDLFAAETGALLAMIHALLSARLERFAPGLPARIRGEVRRRVLRPYLAHHYWWMGNGGERMCNWTPWCTQNVLIAAAAFLPARSLPPYIRRAAYSLDCFLKDYGPDGCCDEGAQYYGHAALTCFNALDLLDHMAPGVFSAAWAEPKLKNMAEYIVHMHVDGPLYLNFGDCSPRAGRRGALEYLLGKRVGSGALMALAAADFADVWQTPVPFTDRSEGINLYDAAQAAFAAGEVLAAPREAAAIQNIWYPSAGVLSARSGPWALGVKAGGNGDNHNHNDTGSVTLYKNGRPALIDVGVETYTRKTFSPQRYEIWTMQSAWHNLPTFDPDGNAWQQQPGPEARAEDVRVNDDRSGVAMDLARAYGPIGTVPGLGSYRRTVRLTGEGLSLTDVTDYPGDVALSLMTALRPTAEGDTIRLEDAAAIALHGAQRVAVEPVPIGDPQLRSAWPDTLYRIRVWFRGRLSLNVM